MAEFRCVRRTRFESMRDLFDELMRGEAANPMEAARRNMRTPMRKRFYKTASIGDGNTLLLDGRPVKTPARRPLAAPQPQLAQLVAAEWNAQGEQIDPAAMPLTRLANVIIDGVADAPDAVRGEIESYLGSDLLFYRADAPEGLVARQAALWDPLLDFARNEFDARFVLAQGVVHQTQPREAVEAAASAIPRGPGLEGIWRLGAVAAITTLTGSALIALALARGALTADDAWTAAHVDEDWNMATWGKDDELLTRRSARRAEFDAAALVLKLA
jgi:chaperone required for assembly of F1-ATPase